MEAQRAVGAADEDTVEDEGVEVDVEISIAKASGSAS